MSKTFLSKAWIQRNKRMIGLLLVVLGGLGCIAREYQKRNITRDYLGVDFRAVYSSSRCIVAGCNPYNYADMRVQFLKQGGTVAEAMTPTFGPFVPHYVGYSPPALFYLVPLALLRWPLAWFVFMAIGIGLYAIAALLFAGLCSEYVPLAANVCLALFVALEGDVITLGQPTILAAATLCIAIWCLLKDRYPRLGVICFAFSLLIKPHLGGLLLLYFLIATRSYRRRALQVIALTIILCVPALLWFYTHDATRNWVTDYRTNLTAIAAPGNISDPGPRNKNEYHITDLQSVISLFRDEPSFYNHVAWAITAVLLAVWVYPVLRLPPGREKDIFCIAAMSTLTMLPVYHRHYDCRILLVLFPALALLMRRSIWWGRAATVVTLSITLVLSHYYHFNLNTPMVRRLGNDPWLQALLTRAICLTLLGTTFFYLVVLYVFAPRLEAETEAAKLTGNPA